MHQFAGSGHQVGRQGSDLLDLRRGETAFIEVAGERSEWVASPPLGLLVLRAVPVGASGELPVLVAVAIRLGLDQHRPVPGGCMAPGLADGLPHRERVHAVDDEPEHVLAGGAKHDVGEADGFLNGRRDGVEVVLDDEDRWKPPDACHADPLVERADRRGPVAEERNRDANRVGEAAGVGEPGGDRDPAADDRGGAGNPRLEVDQVHRPAAAARPSVRESEDLGDRPDDAALYRLGHGV